MEGGIFFEGGPAFGLAIDVILFIPPACEQGVGFVLPHWQFKLTNVDM